ncbi:2-dehydro-3-deoxy-6-phosphogalactonate aldolase [Ahrensia kielensis]|uniref:2-dehydro-3-deoxy-6-phosphogalactonate aldolase n=1 Tax=Ahrensia kielensis TaxID=76980 RepID=UPI0003791231|nr:2-dehydro-3-deoxy-6-phosphogalactonate aldolase [Ahrensia kielensis]
MSANVTAQWPDMKRGLVAILRGVKPDEIEPIADALIDAGFACLEIPLNSPDPFKSIEKVVAKHGDKCLIGAGTVLTADNVDQLAGAGGKLMVSPNIDEAVMERCAHHKMVTMPGVFTPTEAFKAIKFGASGLKFFPASVIGASGIKAMMAVLPKDLAIGAVGGVSEVDFADYGNNGILVFGLGSSIYKPGLSADEISARAIKTVAAYDAVFG